MDDRIALLGSNGNGKSTLARLISGRLDAESGTVDRQRKLRVGNFAQHQLDELDPENTPFAHMSRLMPTALDHAVRAQLGRFDFGVAQADTKVKHLSGGEKARLLLALITHNAPHILVLDEPTNHLDVDRREALVRALNAYSGAVILITHDAHLVELIADRLWLVADGKCVTYEGDMSQYRRETLIARQSGSSRQHAEPINKKSSGGDDRPEVKVRDKKPNRAGKERAVIDAERRLSKLIAARDKIETALANPSLYGQSKANISSTNADELSALHKKLSREISATEDRWLAVQQDLENLD
jgi:ATP-binding cassette subfamily F protein 3